MLAHGFGVGDGQSRSRRTEVIRLPGEQLSFVANDEHGMLEKLVGEVHAAAVANLAAAAFLWSRGPRLSRRLVDVAADHLRSLPVKRGGKITN